MGPRSIERGEITFNNGPQVHLIASMGPRSIERGEIIFNNGPGAGPIASMGPRSIERGEWLTYIGVVAKQKCFNGAALN